VAGGLELDALGARSIGRAGAVLVSGDGGTALLLNPGGLARRSSLRVQIGMAIHDDAAAFEAVDSAVTGSPVIEDLGQPVSTPFFAVQGSAGPVLLGGAYVEIGDLARSLPAPERNQLPDDVLTASHVELSEHRQVWAGLEIRADDTVGDSLRDLRLEVEGRDRFVPGACVGVLVAPPQLPMEIALSAGANANAALDGAANLDRTRTDEYPEPVIVGSPTSSASLAMPLSMRAGLRYLGERVSVEANAEVIFFRGDGAAPDWAVDGLTARRAPGVEAALTEVPSLVSQRDHATGRMAVDVEVARGFLWLSLGYAVRAAAARREALSPAHVDLGGHTLALGAEGQWNATTLTIGYSHTFERSLTVNTSQLMLVNPFDAGTMVVGNGRYSRGHDAFGIAMEVAWE